MSTDKKCRECGKRLSEYNYTDRCFHHGLPKDTNTGIQVLFAGIRENSYIDEILAKYHVRGDS